jgi:hypothetical protein
MQAGSGLGDNMGIAGTQRPTDHATKTVLLQ